MKLADLIRDAAAGGAALTAGGGRAEIGLDAAVRLYAAAAEDLDAGHYGSTVDQAGRLPVALESCGREEATVDVLGIRYLLDLEGVDGEAVIALCEARGCPNPALARVRLARVCPGHLTLVTELARLHLALPLAGDDRDPDWRERAGAQVREVRLAAWERQLERQEADAARGRGLLGELRSGG